MDEKVEKEGPRALEQEEKIRARGELQRATGQSVSLRLCVLLVFVAVSMSRWSSCLGPIARLWSSEPAPRSSVSKLERWIEVEKTVALEKVLKNVGPVVGAKDGLVVASPSRGEKEDVPDYYYTWTRDSALTISSLLHHLIPPSYLPPLNYHQLAKHNTPRQIKTESSNSTSVGILLEPFLRAYITSQAELQLLETLSGGLWTGGLSEPKFTARGEVFSGEWGRPQRDGPALRALTLIPYANFLLDRGYAGDIAYVRDHLYSPQSMRGAGNVIKNDLEEVSCTWWEAGFDLWEEVNGHHLFTRLASIRALQLGSALAERLGDPSAANWYADMASKAEQRLANFWVYDKGDSGTGYWASTIFGQDQLDSSLRLRAASRMPAVDPKDELVDCPPTSTGKKDDPDETDSADSFEDGYDRTSLDCAFLLCSIHFGSLYPHSTMDWTSFEPSHPGTLATLHRYVQSFDGLYGINEGRNWTQGWAVGRYSEDVYDGVGKSLAHPWFICTFSVAHVLYLAYTSIARQGRIQISDHTFLFWTDILGSNGVGDAALDGYTWNATDVSFGTAMRGLLEVADAYMDIARRYTDRGRMSEQIDKGDGSPRGARDLTWSYASFLEASRARDEALTYQIGSGVTA